MKLNLKKSGQKAESSTSPKQRKIRKPVTRHVRELNEKAGIEALLPGELMIS